MANQAAQQTLRFLAVGAAATSLNYLLNLILVTFKVSVDVASGTGYLSGMIISFPLNKYWAFQAKKSNTKKELLLYSLVYGTTFLINILLAHLSYDLFSNMFANPTFINGFYYLPVIAITTVLNFIGCKYFIFSLAGKAET